MTSEREPLTDNPEEEKMGETVHAAVGWVLRHLMMGLKLSVFLQGTCSVREDLFSRGHRAQP